MLLLSGMADGTAFVHVTNPEEPEVIGMLPTHTFSSSWRDIKVYKDHAFIVSEASGHGMQVRAASTAKTDLLEVLHPARKVTDIRCNSFVIETRKTVV